MKKFTLTWNEYVEWVATVEAESAEEAEEKFGKGGIKAEINDGQFVDDSLEIYEDDDDQECDEQTAHDPDVPVQKVAMPGQ